MTHLEGNERARYVQGTFARIAGRYDLMNRLMTFGQDVRWRRLLLQQAALPPHGRLLDLGTGTGDIAAAALQSVPEAQVVGADFTLEMMRAGRNRADTVQVQWTCADTLQLPFPDHSFDAVTSGFLMRNVIDVAGAFAEQVRVLRPGGCVVCLDTTPPPENLLRPAIRFHLHTVIPTLGRIITGAADAYTYLPDSTEGFLRAEQLADKMHTAGFEAIGYRRLMMGTVALHWASKSAI